MQRKPVFRLIFLTAVLVAVYGWLVVPMVQTITTPAEIALTPAEYAQLADQHTVTPADATPDQDRYITIKLLGLFPIKKVAVHLLPFDTVAVGGLPVGICGQIDGVLVTADCGPLKTGDIIKAVDGVAVNDLAAFQQLTAPRDQVVLTVQRGSQKITKTVPTATDWPVRDQTAGVGILTYVNPANQNFAALAHPMTDFNTGATVNLTGGTVQKVHTYGIVKTHGHQTGVLQSSIPPQAPAQGTITQGTAFGVYGCLYPDSELLAQCTTTLPVASRYHVKPGKATLRTSLDGTTVEEFSCEIIKTRFQNRQRDKSMIIRVTDPRLLQATGGIVHGMSGSPIIQDGHLVGALTHAITHDPAKGYAVYIDFVVP